MVKHEHVRVPLIGEDGNAFNIIGLTARVIRREVSLEASEEYVTEAYACTSYDGLLALTQRTVHVI